MVHPGWVGLSYNGTIVTGWGGMAHSKLEARFIIDSLKAEEMK